MQHATWSGICGLVLAAATTPFAQERPRLDPAAVRAIIQEHNVEWGRARVALDTAAFERTLAPEFYIQMRDRRMTREEFIKVASGAPPGLKLTRFEATVLTVQPAADGWVAVIREKLEYERTDGTGKVFSLWITRDGWRNTGDRWVATFSEAIGSENWRDGMKPPFADW
jgi:hypothetical protein